MVVATKSITVSACTDIDETFLNNGRFNLYPNPSSGYVLIKTNKVEMSEGKIYSILGGEVMRFTIGKEETPLDISSLRKGIYFIQVGNATKKIMLE
jgi:hypothetical protein